MLKIKNKLYLRKQKLIKHDIDKFGQLTKIINKHGHCSLISSIIFRLKI